MEAFKLTSGSLLQWVQPKTFERQFELRTDDSLLGVLRFETAFGTLASSSIGGEQWTFKRVGFFNSHVTIRAASGTNDVAIYWPKLWNNGWLEFDQGNRFHWKSLNFWGSEWGFCNAREELIFSLKQGSIEPKVSDIMKTQAIVKIEPQSQNLSELPLLLMLGWYLMIKQKDDTTTVLITTTSAAVMVV